jgi:hypothetical protein
LFGGLIAYMSFRRAGPSPLFVGQLLGAFARLPKQETFIMAWLIRNLRIPASESNMGFVLALCIFTLSIMSIAIVWQAQVIAKQNVLIQQMSTRFGG